jgi:hypothetical protein
MSRFVVDTNLPVVANGRSTPGDRSVAIDCRLAAIEFLNILLRDHCLVLDLAGEIQGEYRAHLEPRGEPGVGDRFYLEVLNSRPGRVERVDLGKTDGGDYAAFPTDPELSRFDRSDRKFVALSCQLKVPVAHAVDSDLD